jgi:hypothetical protein
VDVLNIIATIAAIILAIELLIVTLIVLAVCAGLAFGMRWVQGKTDWAFAKVHGYVQIGLAYERKGLTLASKPFIVVAAGLDTVTTTVDQLWSRVRSPKSVGVISSKRSASGTTGETAARPLT